MVTLAEVNTAALGPISYDSGEEACADSAYWVNTMLANAFGVGRVVSPSRAC